MLDSGENEATRVFHGLSLSNHSPSNQSEEATEPAPSRDPDCPTSVVVRVAVWKRPGHSSDVPHHPTHVLEGRFAGSNPEKSLHDLAPDENLPEPGEVFAGFHLIRVLGSGAIGRVYLAHQDNLANRPVVLKIARQLWGECQTLARLQHTNIVPVYSTHQDGNFQAFCMPYLGAVTLAEIIRNMRQTGLPAHGEYFHEQLRHADYPGVPTTVALDPLAGKSYVEAVLWIGLQLAHGLAHAHQRGLVHCDIKPANVLFSDDGIPMLLDFNVAMEMSRDSSAGMVIGGTMAYMSPEQLLAVADQPVRLDGRSDLYSLGLVLFELLTGRLPYEVWTDDVGTALRRMTEAQCSAGFKLRESNPAVTPAIEAIILKCLGADQGERYQSANELAEDLERQLENRPLRFSREPSYRERIRKWVRRNRWLTSGPALACGLAMIAFAVAAVSLIVVRHRHLREINLHHESAAEQFAILQPEIQQAQLALATAPDDSAAIRQAAEKGETILSRYGVREDADWSEREAVRYLSNEDRRRLLEDTDTLLFLLDRASRTDAAELRAKPVGSLTRTERFRLACDMSASQHDKESLELLRQICADEPGHVGAWFLRGHSHARLGQHAEASGAFGTCIVLRPQFSQAYFQRGISYHAMRDYPQALTDFDRLVRMEPKFMEGFVRRGVTLQFLNRHADAVVDFTAAIDLGEHSPRLFIMRSRAKAGAGDKTGAEDDMKLAMSLTPTDEAGWVERGLARANKEPAAAVGDFEAALSINPRSYPAMQNLAWIYSGPLRNDKKAAEVLDQLRKYHPNDLLTRRGRAVVLARLGRIDEALREASECRKLDSSPLALYQLAGVYAHAGKTRPEYSAQAIRLLAWSVGRGYGGEMLATDPDTEPLRKLEGFQQILRSHQELMKLVK
ncbi:serine/threonine-protein kinase [Zavarzinella formosa]|uniref:serine/threonine-protein kinase n=1 Tax=Zavarzinella formosa TaxID=360055 RepID=UPI0002F50441|nr:serine/threonine-protein kinase [Zavarzinella formosa]